MGFNSGFKGLKDTALLLPNYDMNMMIDCISVAKIRNKSNNVLQHKGFSQENIH